MGHDNQPQDVQERAVRPAWKEARVSVDHADEASYWCRQLHCTEAALRAALKSVGSIAEDVERHLDASRKR
ncbi:MAG TPA: DUF3606 domain-containing protein [Usitatibacter sp.]|nr:DUF3606 domain-containing protein [Usitatibacter sp.]